MGQHRQTADISRYFSTLTGQSAQDIEKAYAERPHRLEMHEKNYQSQLSANTAGLVTATIGGLAMMATGFMTSDLPLFSGMVFLLGCALTDQSLAGMRTTARTVSAETIKPLPPPPSIQKIASAYNR